MNLESLSSFIIAGIVVLAVLVLSFVFIVLLNIQFSSSVILVLFVIGTLIFAASVLMEALPAAFLFFIVFVVFFSVVLSDIFNGILAGSVATVLLTIIINVRYCN